MRDDTDDAPTIFATAADLLREVERQPIDPRLIEHLRACSAELERQRKAERQPHDRAIVEINRRFREPIALLTSAIYRLKFDR